MARKRAHRDLTDSEDDDYDFNNAKTGKPELWGHKKLSMLPNKINDDPKLSKKTELHDCNGRSVRSNRGQRDRAGFDYLDSSTLVIDSSEGEDNPNIKKRFKDDVLDTDVVSDDFRSPSPPTSPLSSPLPADPPLSLSEASSPGSEILLQPGSKVSATPWLSPSATGGKFRPLKITLEVPKGNGGQVVVDVDLSSLWPTDSITLIPNYSKVKQLPSSSAGSTSSVKKLKVSDNAVPRKVSFLSLSGEIRNRIYRLVLKTDPITLLDRENLSHSANLLRTSRQVHAEARGILYGENRFVFERDPQRTARFFEPVEEIGFANIRRFFEIIGPINIGLLRDVGFFFNDATSATAPEKPPDKRRYVNDAHCVAALKLLGKHSRLECVDIWLCGRRKINLKYDGVFTAALKSLCSKTVTFNHRNYQRYTYSRKFASVSDKVKDEITLGITGRHKKMVRKERDFHWADNNHGALVRRQNKH